MNTHEFILEKEDSLIVLKCFIGDYDVPLAVDTGASHTVVDLTVMLMAGFVMKDVLRTVKMETANGIVEGYIFKVPNFRALGLERKDMEICAYDLLASGVVSDFDGTLGLDFFKDTDLFISFKRFEIVLS